MLKHHLSQRFNNLKKSLLIQLLFNHIFLNNKKDDSDFIYSVNESKKKVSTINFIKFETKSINAVLDYMEKHLESSQVVFILFYRFLI